MRFFAVLFLFGSFFLNSGTLAGAEWVPITDAELRLKASTVEKDADAEAIFWNVDIWDEHKGSDLEASQFHYLRIKIFNERGRERAKVEIVYGGKTNVSGVAGRTIKPDGSVVEMKRDAVFDKEVFKGKGAKVHARTFTLPDVQPGDIIEYQWRQTTSDAVSNYLRLPLQRDIPIQLVRYQVKPVQLDYLPYRMKSMTLHADSKHFVPVGNKGFNAVEYRNMPAFREEPYMPPDDQLRAWILIYYAPDADNEPDKYWQKVGRTEYARFREQIKVNGDVKKIALEITSGAKTDDEKIRALYAWVRHNVTNVYGTDTSASERATWKENANSGDTMKKRMGTGRDINMLFAALTQAAGLESRVTLTGDRGDIFFSPLMANSYFLRGEDIAIRTGGAWKLYDPATQYMPCGLLSWREQGGKVLITDPKDPEWVQSKMNSAAESEERHVVRMKLGKDGGLEGTVGMFYTGHDAASQRARLHPMKAAERDQALIDEMKSEFAEPEVTGIQWNNVDDPEKELSVSFSLKAPDYAQRTGRRIFVQPALFHHRDTARFPGSTRTQPIYFQHPWKETDDVEIELPEGYALDHPDIPGELKVNDVFHYKIAAQVRKGDRSTLAYRREFSMEGALFPVEAYSELKRLFDKVRENDQHSMSIMQAASSRAQIQ